MYVSFNIVVKYGSTYVVCRQKKTPTYKDLDFVELHPEGILLEADTHQALIKTIERDCRVCICNDSGIKYVLLSGLHALHFRDDFGASVFGLLIFGVSFINIITLIKTIERNCRGNICIRNVGLNLFRLLASRFSNWRFPISKFL